MDQEQRHIHKFTDTVVPPTCQERGYTLHSCDCGYSHKDQFTPLGSHQYEIAEATVATCTDGGSRRERCAVCGEEKVTNLPALGHDWENWSVQVFPTCTEGGTEVRRCKRCGNTESRDVAPKGHAPVKSKNEKGETVCFCENCGETVYVPTAGEKLKAFLQKRKKPILITTGAVLGAALLLFGTFQFAIPQFHYTVGKIQLKNDNYEKAFKHFMACWDYRDTEELLQDFTLITEVESRYKKWEGLEQEDSGRDISTVSYRYNSNGYISRGSAPYLEYDDAGRLIQKVYYSESGYDENTRKYEYNDAGICIWECYYEGNEPRYEYRYDDRGNLVEYISYNRTNEFNRTTYANTYDEKGRLISVTKKENDEFTYVECYTYYRNGNKRTFERYTAESTEVSENVWKVTRGNLIWKTKFGRNGKARSAVGFRNDGTVERKYTYYRDGDTKTRKEYTPDGEIDFKIKYKPDGSQTSKSYTDGKVSYRGKVNQYGETLYSYSKDKEYGKSVIHGKYRYDSYGRRTKWIDKRKSYGTGFPDCLFAERRKDKKTYQYTDLEVRYMPDYGAEKNK